MSNKVTLVVSQYKFGLGSLAFFGTFFLPRQ